MKNILITSAGRRVELVQSFKLEAERIGKAIRVFAADQSPNLSAACQVADACFAVPSVNDETYADTLLAFCVQNDIGLVVPTIDTELYLLSELRSRFVEHGVSLVISNEQMILRCRDKRLSGDLFHQMGIEYPKIFSANNITFPCFVKPYNGSCSIGAKTLCSVGEITSEMLVDQSLMFMELIDKSFSEYTIDVYYDSKGQLRCFVPRERLEVRAGEISKGVTRKNFVYSFLEKKLSLLVGARGCLTIQVFARESDEKIVGLEINPRFGGGFPLSYAAGANYPSWLILEYLKKEEIPYFSGWHDNLLMLRYDAKVLVNDYI